MTENEEKNIICEWANVFGRWTPLIFLLSLILGSVLSILSTVAVAKKFCKNRSSSVLFVLLVASSTAVFMCLEFFIVLASIWFWLAGSSEHIQTAIWFLACSVLNIEGEAISVFLVLAVQRLLLWRRPLVFVEQSKWSVICQFGLALGICHLITAASFFKGDLEHPVAALMVYRVIGVAASFTSIVLQCYVSCHRGFTRDTDDDVTENNTTVRFVATDSETDEVETQNMSSDRDKRDSAVPRLMFIISVMTYFMCITMTLDFVLWPIILTLDHQCSESFMGVFTIASFCAKIPMLPASLLFGCKSLRRELLCCKCC